MNQRVSVLGIILQVNYQLHRHRLLGIPMDWLGVGLLLLGALIFVRGPKMAWAGALAGLTMLGLLTIFSSRRLDYLIFRPHTGVWTSPARGGLEPDSQVGLQATGRFAVHGQERYLVEQPAIYTTPRSRDHIVMVKLESTRLLLLGKSDPEAWGWWYQFFRPETITSVQIGQVVHGWRIRPAIKVVYWVEDNKERQQRVETVLSFDYLEHRSLIWADITHDQPKSDASR